MLLRWALPHLFYGRTSNSPSVGYARNIKSLMLSPKNCWKILQWFLVASTSARRLWERPQSGRFGGESQFAVVTLFETRRNNANSNRNAWVLVFQRCVFLLLEKLGIGEMIQFDSYFFKWVEATNYSIVFLKSTCLSTKKSAGSLSWKSTVLGWNPVPCWDASNRVHEDR